jgi:nitroimidazol reductase NimA-like FMN-containing flavoprotein (pyridoxamine 5'-phosphate oxidase superfamily)
MSRTGADDDDGENGIFSAIGPEQCAELLTERSIGRVAWQSADGQQILPVTYVWFEGTVIFRTSPYGVLSELIRPTDVAFEVDDLDQNHHRGWSVVVHGRAEAVADSGDLARMWAVGGVVPWASGTRNLFIRIKPDRLSGRRVAARTDRSW